MPKSNVCDCNDAYILVKRTITVVGQEANDVARKADKNNKQDKSKNCPPFTDSISEVNNTQVDYRV